MKLPGIDVESMENFDYIFNVNLKSVVRLTQFALPYLVKTKGNIVNISSIMSHMILPENPYYAMTKAALNSYTRTCAIKFAPCGVRVNAITPGAIETNILSRYGPTDLPAEYNNPEMHARIIGMCIPMTRIGVADECAAVVAFLASSRASYITGSIYDVDGGMGAATAMSALSMNAVKNS